MWDEIYRLQMSKYNLMLLFLQSLKLSFMPRQTSGIFMFYGWDNLPSLCDLFFFFSFKKYYETLYIEGNTFSALIKKREVENNFYFFLFQDFLE